MRIFHERAFQKAVLTAATVIGVAGVLGGAFLVARGDILNAGGIVGGAVMLGIGIVGLRNLRSPKAKLS